MSVRKLFMLVFLIISLTTSKSFSQERKFGLGIILGEPTGISGKYWLSDKHALDFGIAYSFAHVHSSFSLHGDYLIHNSSWIRSGEPLSVYYGFGARIHFSNKDENTLGARGVIGIVWISHSLPIDAFIEAAPVFNLFPSTSLHLDLAIGGRYFFE